MADDPRGHGARRPAVGASRGSATRRSTEPSQRPGRTAGRARASPPGSGSGWASAGGAPAAAASVVILGRILYLTEDVDLIRRQLFGADLETIPRPLRDNISTDEIAPAWTCFRYDATLGSYALVGLRGGVVTPNSVAAGGFAVLVSGRSKGCGSSRETAPYAERAAGIRLVIAESFEKIYRQNCHNIGLYTSTDFDLLELVRGGRPIPLARLLEGLDSITAEVVRQGGLCGYTRARLAGRSRPPEPRGRSRPMTLAEKIIASHAVTRSRRARGGQRAVAPGDALFCHADVRFSHDYVTAMAAAQLEEGFGADAKVADSQSAYAFRDHLTLLGAVMPAHQRRAGLLQLADDMARKQEAFSRAQGIRLFGESPQGGSETICHNAVLDDIALPGQLVIGTDSHTCTAGALGCLAFGVGSTDMASAWLTADVRVSVPESVQVVLQGRLSSGRTGKDLMLYLMARPYFRGGGALGKVLELSGDALESLSIDERATVANMAVECGAMTAIAGADDVTWSFLAERRAGLDIAALRRKSIEADPGAAYAHREVIELAEVPVMVATPGDPRNGVPLAELGEVRIDIAYGGSCTGGKRSDMDQYASVLGPAVSRGQRVAPGVRFYLQFGSQAVRRYAAERGYIELFTRAGAELVPPSCGACINAGPGVSRRADEVSVCAINRNYPGRSGPGKVYLASPLVVAASALAGRIVMPERASV
jgi:3-isopropylmalate/(R)-2-methylmalate dehydratase large subunit